MEKLFHKINKYSYKLGNSIESNDIQKIDIYTKHHIHHFEQCGKAIIQSGGNMAEFTEMLGEYIGHVNELVDTYTTKLQAEILALNSRSVLASSVGGSIKNNNKINGAKHDMHYIQQYGKAIIQSGGTIGELKESLEGYIAAVAQFLDKYNRMMQEYDAVTDAVKKSNANVLEVKATLNELRGSNATAQQVIEHLQSQIAALKVGLEEVGLEEVGLKEEEGLKAVLESEKHTIKSLIDTKCDDDIMDEYIGECHESLQRIDKVLRKKFVKSDEALIFGYNDDDTRKFYKLIKNNDKFEFIKLLKSDNKVYDAETLLRLIRLNNIKSILQGKEVNIKDFKGKTKTKTITIDALDDVNSLLTNNDDAINEIASFFYDKPIPE